MTTIDESKTGRQTEGSGLKDHGKTGMKNQVTKELEALAETVGRLRERMEQLKSFVKELSVSSVDKSDDKVTWKEFINNTTFHGVRYVFVEGFPMRRFLWFFLVIIGVTLFVYQVTDRIIVYYQRNTNVDVAVKYVSSVEFPSVTICNQNQFRLTSTAKWGMYDFVNNFFSSENTTNLKNSAQDLSNINTTAFLLDTAHQKEDLIHRCTWNGRPCNISEDFKTILTNFGICYTFNHGDKFLTVKESGSNNALRLVLNMEQYEIMRGPQIDAGVKILLHDQGEVPQIKDQGFAVAPGTHTLVGVKQYKVKSLPHPYGDCDDNNDASVSECRLACVTRTVVDKCGCHDIYMTPVNNATYTSNTCQMYNWFFCVPEAVEQFYKTESNCTCAVPCERVVYKPELSYAQLSHLNVQRFVDGSNDYLNLNLSTARSLGQLTRRFFVASETAQRHVKEIVQRDAREINALLQAVWKADEGSSKLDNDIIEFVGKISDDWNLFDYDAFIKDEMLIRTLIADKKAEIEQNVDTDVDLAYEALGQLWKLMGFENNGTTSRLVDFFRFCAKSVGTSDALSASVSEENNEISPTEQSLDKKFSSSGFMERIIDGQTSTITEDLLEQIDDQYPWLNFTSLDKCNETTEKLKNHIQDVFITPYIQYYPEFFSMAQQYADWTGDSAYVKYKECFDLIEEGHGFIYYIWIIVDLIGYLINGDLHVLAIMEEFLNQHGEFQHLISEPEKFDNRLTLTCGWRKEFSEIVGEKAEIYRTNIVRAREYLLEAEKYLDDWNYFLQSIFDNISLMTSDVVKYLDQNITKQELAEEFFSEQNISRREDFLELIVDLESQLKEYDGRLDVIWFLIVRGYCSLRLEDPVVIINDSSVQHLELVKKAAFLDYLGDRAREGDLYGIIIDIGLSIRDRPIKHVRDNVMAPLYKIRDSLKIVETNLREYQDSIKMDSHFYLDNFVAVDIFYQELSYEEIEQNVAFEFLSLLSEIGGFLGLLLGASVLTVFELVDFLTLATINKCKKNVVEPGPSKTSVSSEMMNDGEDASAKGLNNEG